MCETPEHFGAFVEERIEADLYPPLVRYLHLYGAEQFKPKFGTVQIFAEDVSAVPAQRAGMWTRPDVAAVRVWKGKYSTTKQVHLMSFEVKPYRTGDLAAVHQALAQAQFVNQSFLVWNRPHCVCNDPNYDYVFQSCVAHGVGLIAVHAPSNLQTFEVRLDARVVERTVDELDEFVETRFAPNTRKGIIAAL
jgi:hypothetical protein